MLKVVGAQIYSMQKNTAMGYELEYSNGSRARAIVSSDGWITIAGKEQGGEWIEQKPYIVKKDSKRQGERIVKEVKEILGVK